METSIAQTANFSAGSNTQVSTQTQGSTSHHGTVVNTIEAPVEANHAGKAQKGVDQEQINSGKRESTNSPVKLPGSHSSAQEDGATQLDALEKQLDKVREQFSAVGRNLEFSVDKDSEKLVVKVVDPVTKETIRQIPSEKFLKMSESIDKARGNLLDDKV